MEDPYSVNRILSFSKNRKATVSFPDPDEKASSFGDHGPKPSEVYGFVGSITTVVAAVIFMVWAYVPEHWLHSVGIFYYPSRYWALAVPAYVMVTIVLALGFYIGLNLMSTPPPTSFNTLYARVNGLTCKNAAMVIADDFYFAGLHIAGNTSNAVGSRVTPVTVTQND